MKSKEGTHAIIAGLSRSRYSLVDLVPWLCVIVVYFAAPGYLPLGTQILVMIIFALSLDLLLGYGGVETLGHAALFGAGSYTAGLLALHVSGEPLSGIFVAGLAGSLVAALSGPLILRMQGLTLVMMTLAMATVLYELANALTGVTGGADGLYGFQIQPILGLFAFDLFGHTAYVYAAIVAAIVFLLCKVIVNSSFGLTIRGIRENQMRMRMLGVPVVRRLVLLYAISGFFAGVAGGLSAQITQLVGLDSLSFVLSGNVLIMLILGGTGSLYGAIAGAAVYVLLSDRIAAWNPFHWLFIIGVVLILAVRFAPQGLIGLLARRRTDLK
jgi:branched-chain amino acid transport system permease protein